MVGSLKDCRADARLVAARLDLGDRGGVEPWIASIESAGAMEREASSKLAPFWMFPQDRFLAAHAERILASNAASAGFTPEFLGIASFRVQLLAVLENGTSAIGTAWRDEKGVSFGAVMLAGPGRGGMKIRQRPDYRDAPAGTRRTLRTKDLAAWNVSSIAGVRLGLDWTQEDRDQAIGEIARFIRENGDHLRVFPEHPTDWTCGRPSIFVKR